MFILGSLESTILLVLIELFSLGVKAEALRAKINGKGGSKMRFDCFAGQLRQIS